MGLRDRAIRKMKEKTEKEVEMLLQEEAELAEKELEEVRKELKNVVCGHCNKKIRKSTIDQIMRIITEEGDVEEDKEKYTERIMGSVK